MKTIKQYSIRLLVLPFVFAGYLIFAFVKSFEFTYMFLKNGGEIGANYGDKERNEKDKAEFIELVANAVVNKLQK